MLEHHQAGRVLAAAADCKEPAELLFPQRVLVPNLHPQAVLLRELLGAVGEDFRPQDVAREVAYGARCVCRLCHDPAAIARALRLREARFAGQAFETLQLLPLGFPIGVETIICKDHALDCGSGVLFPAAEVEARGGVADFFQKHRRRPGCAAKRAGVDFCRIAEPDAKQPRLAEMGDAVGRGGKFRDWQVDGQLRALGGGEERNGQPIAAFAGIGGKLDLHS